MSGKLSTNEERKRRTFPVVMESVIPSLHGFRSGPPPPDLPVENACPMTFCIPPEYAVKV